MSQDPIKELLLAAARDPSAKQDAVAALLMRSVWIATWKPRSRAYRTLINAQNQEALAIFTDEANLNKASSMLGWTQAGAHIDRETLQGERLFRYVKKHSLPFLVVDVAADHALEITREDVEACLRGMSAPPPQSASSKPPQTASARPKKRASIVELPSMAPNFDASTGAYGAAMTIPGDAKVPDLRGIVRKGPAQKFRAQTSPPPAAIDLDFEITEDVAPEPLKKPLPAPPPAKKPASVAPARAAQPSRAPAQPSRAPAQRLSELPPTERLSQIPPGYALSGTPEKKLPDALLQYLRKFLAGYPEVEWAAHCQLKDPSDTHHDTIALKVMGNYRQNLIGIAAEIRSAGNKEAIQLTVLVVEDPQYMRQAKENGIMFYPWRK